MNTFNRVALIGLDGSGKSANINQMKIDQDYKYYRFIWVRWKPTLLKPAYWILRKKVNINKELPLQIAPPDDCIEKHMEEHKKLSDEYNKKSGMKKKIFKNPIIRSLWMFLAITDYFVQFYIKTIALMLGKKNIIFDRFYLDLFVDQGINFGYSTKKIERQIKKYQWLFPGIKQYIYIRISPKTCYKRKDDIPNMEYLVRRFDIYERLCANPSWVTVDGEMPFNDVYKSIKDIILYNAGRLENIK